MENHQNFGDIIDLLQSLEDTRDALSGFATMLELSLHNDGASMLNLNADGISLLLRQQLDKLENIEGALRLELKSISERELEDDRVRNLLASVGIDDSGPDVIRKCLMSYFRDDDRIARTSRYLGINEDTVKLVLSCALNPHAIKEPEQPIAPAQEMNLTVERSKPADLNKGFIVDKLKDGIDTVQIAQTLNLKRATVERVIGQLMADQSPPEEDNDQEAVNG